MLGVVGDDFIKKETLAEVFSCTFYEIFQDTFFTEHLKTTAFILKHFMLMNDLFSIPREYIKRPEA